MPTIRAEFHRLRPGAVTRPRRDVGSTVFQVFDGEGHVSLAGVEHTVATGDMVVVPSWVEWSIGSDAGLDLFTFSDAPIVERLHLNRTLISEGA